MHAALVGRPVCRHQGRGIGPVRFFFRRRVDASFGAYYWKCERAEAMAGEPIRDADPTGEAEALEFDGTKTDQLDETYRKRVASASESDALSAEQKPPTLDPADIDKIAGYDPYETAIELEPQKDLTGTKRNVKPLSK